MPSFSNGKIKGCVHSLYRGRAQGAEVQRPAARACFSERLARRASRDSAVGCSLGRRRGSRAERRGGSEPRVAGESRSRCTRSSLGLVPAPEIPRLVLHAQPGLLGGGRGGARDGGGGGAPIIAAAAADPGSHARPSRLRPVENSSLARTRGRKGTKS